jgi:hypothetical protein
LKLVRFPRSLTPTLVALPSMSLIPFAPFFLQPSSFPGSSAIPPPMMTHRDAIIARLAKAARDRAQSLGR